MAEIKIEKKKPVWPWILLGLIILAVILYFVFADDGTDNVLEEENTEQVMETSEPEEDFAETDTATWEEDNLSGDDSVSKYVSHIGNTERMGMDHEYSSNALVYLINALENRADEANLNTDMEIQELKNDVRQIKEDPMSTDHANKIKNVGTKIANLMEKIQKEKFPNISQDVQQVRTAVQNIQPSTPTLDQKDAVNSFYKEAGDVLEKMKMS